MADKAEAPSSFRGVLAPLRFPDYRRLLVSNTLWWQARWMEQIVVGWLVLEMTDSAWQVALVGFYRMAPLLVVSFFSGPIVDRLGHRRAILMAQTVNLAVSAIIVLLLWTGRLAFYHLTASALILGVTWTLNWTARRSFIPDLVGKDRTVEGILLENFTQNFSRILGPFASGALIELLSVRGCYAVLTSISALSLLAVLRLSSSPPPRPAGTRIASPWALMVEGLRYVRRNPSISAALLITVTMNFLIFPYQALLPVFARDILHQGPVGLGLLGAASGIGSFAGLLIINRIRHIVNIGRILTGGCFLMSALMVGFSASTHFPLSLALLTLSGIGHACFSVSQSSIVLLTSSDEMRSRAMGTLALAIGAGPPGRLQVGALAEAFGAPFAVGLTASLSALAIGVITAAVPRLRQETGRTEGPQPRAPETEGK